MDEKPVATPAPMTYDQFRREIQYYEERIQDLRKKMRLLVRILVDKKIIGDEIAKTFEETALLDKKELIKWYDERRKKP